MNSQLDMLRKEALLDLAERVRIGEFTAETITEISAEMTFELPTFLVIDLVAQYRDELLDCELIDLGIDDGCTSVRDVFVRFLSSKLSQFLESNLKTIQAAPVRH
jgi:hypothetical protein